MQWSFTIFVNEEMSEMYIYHSKEKAEKAQADYINEKKRIGCWPINGVSTKVEQIPD